MSSEPRAAGRPVGYGLVAVAIGVIVAVVASLALGDDDPVPTGAAPATTDTESPSTGPATTDPPSTGSPSTGSPSTDPPSTDTSVPEGEDLAGAVPLESVLDDMIAFVERERGLEFIERPEVRTQPEDEFVDQLLAEQAEDFAEDAEYYEIFSRIYQILGVLDAGVTIPEAVESLGASGAFGYYQTERDELYVRGTEITPLVRSVIVHELVHALDDQHFELYRPEYDDRDDEVGFGFASVTEGNASRIEDAYVAGYSDAEMDAYIGEQLGFEYDLGVLTPDFLELQLAPYTAGQEFVEAVVDDEGQEGLDALFEEPPVTSEQVLHPDRRDEPAVDVAPPPADGEVLEEGLVGEHFLQVTLASVVGLEDAAEATDGWGGDWFVIWEDGDELCLRMVAVGDTDDDTDELAAALAAWAAEDGEIDARDGAPVFTRCG